MREKLLLIFISIAFLMYGIYWVTKIQVIGVTAGFVLLSAACIKVIGDFIAKKAVKKCGVLSEEK